MSTSPLPAAVRTLGVAGLLPPALALAMAVRWPDTYAFDLMAGLVYAGVILSFLGGMWWMGLLLRARIEAWPYIVAVLPSLWAWVVLIEPEWGEGTKVLLMGAALLASPLVDRALASRVNWPAGWLRLRLILATGLGLLTLAWLVI
jgi:hypothetical protein